MRVDSERREMSGRPVPEGEREFSTEIAQALPAGEGQVRTGAQYDRLCQVQNLNQQVAGAEAQLLGSLTTGTGFVVAVVGGMGGLSERSMQDAVSGGIMGGALMSGGEVVRRYGVELYEEASERSCRR